MITYTHAGPSFCELCGQWPAAPTKNGLRCNLCADIDYAREHSVPLPQDPRCLQDLADCGVIGAEEALANLRNEHVR